MKGLLLENNSHGCCSAWANYISEMNLVEEIKTEQGSPLNRPIDNRSRVAKNLGKIKFRKKLSMIHQALFPMIFFSNAWRECMPSIYLPFPHSCSRK